MSLTNESVAVITGAASGLGRALAVRLAKEKIAGIAIADTDGPGLDETAEMAGQSDVKISKHILDVSDRESVERFTSDVVENHRRATHLVNNAGVGVIGTFDQLSIEDFEWLIGINLWGVIYGCHAFLPVLKQQSSAHIVNISSVFGLVGVPEQTAYTASKFAVRGFTESLRHELADTSVAVSCVHPGGIKTNIVRNARIGETTPQEWKNQGARFFDKVAHTTPEEAAEVIVKGIKSKNPKILIGKDAKTINLVSRLFPTNYLGILERLNGHKMSLRKK